MNAPGDAHFLTFTCFNSLPLFRDERNCNYLAQAINTARYKHRFDLWAYVFMPDHAHLLVFPREERYDISRILQSIKQPVATRAINSMRRDDPGALQTLSTGQRAAPFRFWRDGGGYDGNLCDVRDISAKFDYIHNNPVDAGLVSDAAQWHWSSASYWLEDIPGPLAIDRASFPSC